MAPTPTQRQQLKTLHDQIYALEMEAMSLRAQASVLSEQRKALSYEVFGSGRLYEESESC